MHGSAVGRAGLVIALTAIASSARADDGARAAARAHFARGVELANAGDYGGALSEFIRAYELSPNYSVLYNMGQAYVALDRPVQAFDTFTRYMAEGAARIPPARRSEVEAEVARQRARIAAVSIRTDAPDATITIDDEPIGRTPLNDAVRVSAGTHHIVAKLDNGVSAEKTLSVVGEQSYTLELTLSAPPAQPTPEPSPAPAIAPPATIALSVSCAIPGVQVLLDDVALGGTPLLAPIATALGPHRLAFAAPAPSLERHAFALFLTSPTQIDCGFVKPAAPVARHTQRKLGYATGAVGIGLGVAAVAHYLWNLGRYHEWQRRFRDHPVSDSADAESVNRLGRSIQQASAVSVGLGIGAGLAFGTGAILLVTDGKTGVGSGAVVNYSGRF